jgi:DNA end-binding protein Ku
VAARSIWNGTLTFGQLAVGVKLFSAVEDHSIHFHEVSLRDGARIVHRRVGVDSGREVPAERVAKAYQSSRARQVILEDREIAAARGSRPKVIEIEHFVDGAQIDPVFYEHAYILGAQPGGERAYRVLLAALQRAEKVGIGRFVLRTREQLVGLRPRGKALMLYTMRFADEVVDRSDLKVAPLRRKPTAKEIAMAERLIETLAADWRPARHKDRYRAAVLELVRRKAAGEQVKAPAQEPAQHSDDLLAALEQSLRGRPRKRSGRPRAGRPREGSPTRAAKASSGKAKPKAKAKARSKARAG